MTFPGEIASCLATFPTKGKFNSSSRDLIMFFTCLLGSRVRHVSGAPPPEPAGPGNGQHHDVRLGHEAPEKVKGQERLGLDPCLKMSHPLGKLGTVSTHAIKCPSSRFDICHLCQSPGAIININFKCCISARYNRCTLGLFRSTQSSFILKFLALF